jgi:tight adherence protein C
MSVMDIFGAVLLVLIGSIFFLALTTQASESSRARARGWQHAREEEKSMAGRFLLSMSQPFFKIDRLYAGVPSRQYRYLQSRLLASGKFGSDVDVFLAAQASAVFIGLLLVSLAFFEKGVLAIVVGLLGILLMAYPWNIVSKASKARARQVSIELPEFVELLAMTVEGGMGLEAAMSFTARQVGGLVSDEVQNMLTLVRNNPNEEAAAYQLAGERLGTPESRTFFSSLLQAQLEGTKILENLASQARSLRIASFQRQRVEIKKLPNKMVIILGIHLMPLLLVIAIFPLFNGLSKI